MCGITAILGFHGRIERRELDTLNEAIRHRGPDDIGAFVHHRSEGFVALGHVRLAVIDTSHRGHQPMGLAGSERAASIVIDDEHLDSARLIIAYNGEVYNFAALRESLITLGWEFQSGTDTEVLLKGYAEWGESLAHRLIGMYTFVVYDRDNSRVFACRDFPGIKPLYIYRGGERIYFASEVKAFSQFDLPVDDERVREYMASKYIDTESMSAEVRCVPPGGWVRVDLESRELSRGQHCTLGAIVESQAYKARAARTEDQLIDDLDRLLSEVVDDQMVADVPAGTICSGGIDSSLVTALAARSHRELKIFTLDVKSTSEVEYARTVAKHLGVDIIEVPFEKSDFDALAARSAHFKDTPLVHPNSVAILKLSQAVRDNGVKVILSGEGADEVFGGYQKYIDYNRVLRLRRWLPKLNKTLVPFIADDRTVRMIVDHEVTPADLWRIWPATDERDRLQSELRERYLGVGESAIGAEISSLVAKDIHYYLNPLLRRADRMTMAVGIEGRVPMLDQRIIEFGLNLPVQYKVRFFHGGKYLLKKVAERYLPKSIVWRKKKGLPIPVAEWTGLESKVQQKGYFLDLWRQNTRLQG